MGLGTTWIIQDEPKTFTRIMRLDTPRSIVKIWHLFYLYNLNQACQLAEILDCSQNMQRCQDLLCTGVVSSGQATEILRMFMTAVGSTSRDRSTES